MYEHLTLNNIARGMAPKLFDRELQKVLENIQDTRTSPKKARKIVLEFVLTPDQERHALEISVNGKSSLVNAEVIRGYAFTSLDGEGNPIVTMNDPEQLTLMDQLKTAQGEQE